MARKRISKNLKDIGNFDLIAAVSHEIRTPVSSIKGYATILSGGDLGDINSGQKIRLKRIIELCDYLASLTDNLICASEIRLGREKRQRELLKITDIIKSALSILRLQVKQKQMVVKVDMPKNLPQLWGEKKALEQVFINLINNAVKFTPLRGRVTITAKVEKRKYIRMEVSDSGIGIPKDSLSKIFTPFYRVSSSIDRCGVGLGLSIVKGIVKLHKGEITVYSIEGKGSRFSFIVPIDLRNSGRRKNPEFV